MFGEDILKKSAKKKTLKKPAVVQFSSDADFYQRVEKKAYELYEGRGYQSGNDWQDWFEAEQIVRNELK
jgi:hypothetical protein